MAWSCDESVRAEQVAWSCDESVRAEQVAGKAEWGEAEMSQGKFESQVATALKTLSLRYSQSVASADGLMHFDFVLHCLLYTSPSPRD